MKLLDEFALQAIEVLFNELVRKAVFMAAVNEPGARYGDPIRQFYAAPPIGEYEIGEWATPSEPSVRLVTVNVQRQSVEGDDEAIRNMARQQFMQKYIAQQIRDHADRVMLALFKGEMK